jgi:hypothetical protein
MKSNKKYSQTSLEWELHIINQDNHLSIDQQRKWSNRFEESALTQEILISNQMPIWKL